MKRRQLGRHALVLTLLAVSLFSLTPARADRTQVQVGTVVFHLTGQANSMNATSSLGSATLDLTGEIHGDGEGGLVMENLTGNLQIGSTNYSIFTGNGSSNRLGEFAIFGQSSAGGLILHGLIQHNSTVTADAPPSRLSSLAYLALSGNMTLNITSVMNVGSSLNATSTFENRTSAEVSVNSTQSEFSSSISNFTSHSEASNENSTQSASNTASLSQTASYALPEQNNTTNATQFNGQTTTIYVSNTVANTTITQTITATVADTTITQFSSATVSNATVIVTNSTYSSP